MQLMYTNGLTHWTEPIDDTQPLVGFQTSEVKLKRDHSRFIVLYSHEAEDSHLYYKAFDADSTGKYIPNESISVDRNRNFSFDAEGNAKQFLIEMVSSKSGGGFFLNYKS